jgi:ABC-type Fe3+-hydroxamate transport system substrate-binding protein
VSIEAVSVRDPDLILTTAAGPASFAERPEWQVVRAVRQHRFLNVSGSEYERPGPRSPGAIRALSKRLEQAAR